MNKMAKDKSTNQDDKMGQALEKSFRKAVSESIENGYVSFYDEPANSGESLDVLRLMLDKDELFHLSNDKKSAKKKA